MNLETYDIEPATHLYFVPPLLPMLGFSSSSPPLEINHYSNLMALSFILASTRICIAPVAAVAARQYMHRCRHHWNVHFFFLFLPFARCDFHVCFQMIRSFRYKSHIDRRTQRLHGRGHDGQRQQLFAWDSTRYPNTTHMQEELQVLHWIIKNK